MYVVGVDGIRQGWLAIRYEPERPEASAEVHRHFQDVIDTYCYAKCIAVDIPIGLAEGSIRECDVEARRALGTPRGSSVFPAPDPRVLNACSQAEASARSRELIGKGVSMQSFGIFQKIAEVNCIMTPKLQKRVIEVHPEVSFWAMAGECAMQHRKHLVKGFEERRAWLVRAFSEELIPTREKARALAPPARPDDVLDAIAAAWTAIRFARCCAERLPSDPPVDSRGLRMEIVY